MIIFYIRYTLQNNVSSNETCFTITAQNVTLDCNGNWINYSTSGTGYTHGIYATQNSTTIKNCNVIDGNWSSNGTDRYGIWLYSADNSNLSNNYVRTNLHRTIWLFLSSNAILTNNTAISNASLGIMILGGNNVTLTNNTGVSNSSTGIEIQSSIFS